MRIWLRAFCSEIIAISAFALLISSIVTSAGSEEGAALPSAADVRIKLERLLDSVLLSSYSIETLEIRDGRAGETPEHQKGYEVRFFALVNYPGGQLRCRVGLCPELQNFVVTTNDVAKKVTIAGWLFFEQTNGVWR